MDSGGGRTRVLATVVLVAWAAACAPLLSPAPTPAGRPGESSSALSQAPPIDSAGLAALPAMLFAGPGGLAISDPGRPDARAPLRLPSGLWQPTAAVGPGGELLLVSPSGAAPTVVLVGRLGGAAVAPLWRAILPAGRGDALPGCLAGDGSATVIADALLVLGPHGVRAVRDVPATVGRCQMADPETVLYVGEDDHGLVAWSLGAGTVTRSLTRCDDFSLGGAWLACLGVGGDAVTVGRWGAAVAGEPALLAAVTIPIDGGVAQVLLVPDGDEVATVAAGGGVAVYRRGTDGAFARAGAFSLGTGETLLGFVGT